jgi:hypothetical protein
VRADQQRKSSLVHTFVMRFGFSRDLRTAAAFVTKFARPDGAASCQDIVIILSCGHRQAAISCGYYLAGQCNGHHPPSTKASGRVEFAALPHQTKDIRGDLQLYRPPQSKC